MAELISVIIPAYNVEPYLQKCVESVLRQTWENLEILLIDDGSTDRTSEICDQLAEQDSRIKVIHQQNGGLSVARNVGLDNCRGSWVAFLDSDDWIEPEMYEQLYRIATENNVCLSSCLSRDVIDGNGAKSDGDGSILLLDYSEIIHELQSGKIVRFEVWNKLWKRDLIGDVRFIPGQVAEDVHFDRLLFGKAQRVAHIQKVFHNYLISRPGNTNSSFKTARLCIFDEFEQWRVKLIKDQMPQLAAEVAAIATNFAVDIYGNAVRTKQDRKIIHQLKDYFKHFYSLSGEAVISFKRRMKFRLFKIHPSLISLL